MTDNLEPNVDNPGVENPVKEPVEPDAAVMQTELLEQLQTYGVADAQDLDNKMTAASESGRLANYLGEARQENQLLRKEIQDLRQDVFTQQRQSNLQTDDYGEPVQQPASVDLEQVIEKKMEKVLGNFVDGINKQQAEANQAYTEVANDKHFTSLKPVFDNHMNNPQVQAAVQEGRTTLRQEYDRIVIAYQGEMLKKANTVLQGLSDGKVVPPHVEGTQIVEPSPAELDKRKARFEELHSKQYPTEADVSEAIKLMLPDDDPIFRV